MVEPAKNCMSCDAPDSDENMVQCDHCKLWAHFSCADVTEDIRKKPWSCQKCANQLHVTKPKTKSKTRSGSKSDISSKSDNGSVKSMVSAIEQLEEEQEAKEQALEEERKLRERKLEMEKALREKRMKQEQELREKEFRLEQELRQQQLLQEREMLERRLAAEERFLREQHHLREQFQIAKKHSADRWAEPEGAVGGDLGGEDDPETPLEEKVKNWLEEQRTSTKQEGDPRGAYPKNPVPKKGQEQPVKKLTKLERLKALLAEDSDEEDAEKVDPVQIPPRPPRQDQNDGRSNGSGNLTQDQIAARQVMSRQLPTFKGEPEIWPLFISSYENTTKACGFTNLDNLKRLQDCLQGEALEAVRSRLILPDSVPGVMNDLRNLFGKSEKLLKALLLKVRRASPPKAEKLETFLHFGITEKQLCDHLEAAELTDHLSNPMLVQELVDKLPPIYKLDWVRFKRCSQGTPL